MEKKNVFNESQTQDSLDKKSENFKISQSSSSGKIFKKLIYLYLWVIR